MRLLLLQLLCFVPLIWTPYFQGNADLHLVLFLLLPPSIATVYFFQQYLDGESVRFRSSPLYILPLIGIIITLLQMAHHYFTPASIVAEGVYSYVIPPNPGPIVHSLFLWCSIGLLMILIGDPGVSEYTSSGEIKTEDTNNDGRSDDSLYNDLALTMTVAGGLFGVLLVMQYMQINILPFQYEETFAGTPGTLNNPTFAAGLLATVFPIALYYTVGSHSTIARFATGILCIAIVAGILLTNSRAGALGLVVSLVILFGLVMARYALRSSEEGENDTEENKGDNKDEPEGESFSLQPACWATVLLLGMFIVGGVFYGQRSGMDVSSIVDPEHETNAVRLAVWEGTADMIGEHTWMGAGAGNFVALYPPHRKEREMKISDPENMDRHPGKRVSQAHSIFLHRIAEWGIPAGGLFWGLLFYLFISRLWRFLNRRMDYRTFLRNLGWAGGVTGFLVTGLVTGLFQSPAATLYFFLVFSLFILEQEGVDRQITFPGNTGIPGFVVSGFFVLVPAIGLCYFYLTSSYNIQQARATQNRSEEAQNLSRAIESYPFEPRAMKLLGDRLRSQNPEQARNLYERGLSLAPYDYPLLNSMAIFMARQTRSENKEEGGESNDSDIDRARQLLDRAISLVPTRHTAYLNRGLLHQWQNNSEAAREDFQQALERKPDLHRAARYLVILAALREDREDIIRWLTHLRDNGFERTSLLRRENVLQPFLQDPDISSLIEEMEE